MFLSLFVFEPFPFVNVDEPRDVMQCAWFAPSTIPRDAPDEQFGEPCELVVLHGPCPKLCETKIK